MKIKIDFTKLLWNYHCYSLDVHLEMINWFFATGLEGDYEKQRGWNRSGINQLLYGYSANNENYHAVPFPIDWSKRLREFMTSIFVRAIVSPASCGGGEKEIAEWREKNKIGLGKYRFFEFPVRQSHEANPGRCDTSYYLHMVAEYEGKELKKEYAHPDYLNRTCPKIIGVTFSTCGKGYFVEIMFSFWEFNYEPGWSETIATQRKGEHIGDFLARAYKKLKAITVNTEATKRLKFETENNFQTYTKKGCYNCTWIERNKNLECGLMKRHRGVKNCSIDAPSNHICDEWQYHDKRKPQTSVPLSDRASAARGIADD